MRKGTGPALPSAARAAGPPPPRSPWPSALSRSRWTDIFPLHTLDEYAQAAEDYAKIDPELGGRFYDEIERLIGDACRAPLLFRRIRGPIRRHFSTVFPFAILYEDKPDHVRIVAVMPMQRDPEYWLHRTD